MVGQYRGGRSETVTVKVTAITKQKIQDLALQLNKGVSELGSMAIEAFLDSEDVEIEDDDASES